MSDVTHILQQIESGDPNAAERLLPLVYEELRKLAAAKMSAESLDHTLQPTALVHEAYVRLMDAPNTQHWDGRPHFFAAAAEAMRRILIESARRKIQRRRGGDLRRVELDANASVDRLTPEQLLVVDDALERLEHVAAEAANVFKLKYFANQSIEDAAEMLGMSRATAYRHWTFARAWLASQFEGQS